MNIPNFEGDLSTESCKKLLLSIREFLTTYYRDEVQDLISKCTVLWTPWIIEAHCLKVLMQKPEQDYSSFESFAVAIKQSLAKTGIVYTRSIDSKDIRHWLSSGIYLIRSLKAKEKYLSEELDIVDTNEYPKYLTVPKEQ